MSYKFEPEEMARLMRESRRETEELFKLVKSESDLRRPPAEGFRPILWHLGHVGAFEGYWILQRVKGDPTISPDYDVIFDPIKTPRDDSTNLPAIAEIESYLARVREEVFDFLKSNGANSHPLLRDGYLYHMVLEHEYQHQETLAYLLQLLDTRLKDGSDLKFQKSNFESIGRIGDEMVHVPGGQFELGSTGLSVRVRQRAAAAYNRAFGLSHRQIPCHQLRVRTVYRSGRLPHAFFMER